MNKSENIDLLAGALSKAQANIKKALKESENPFYKNKYADLGAISDACREALSANDLAVSQIFPPAPEGRLETSKAITVETILMHKSGQYIMSSLTLKAVKDDPQGFGSAITYARRYSFAAIVGVVTEDDDGNGSSGLKDDEDGVAPKIFKDLSAKFNMCESKSDLEVTVAEVQQLTSRFNKSQAEQLGALYVLAAKRLGVDTKKKEANAKSK